MSSYDNLRGNNVTPVVNPCNARQDFTFQDLDHTLEGVRELWEIVDKNYSERLSRRDMMEVASKCAQARLKGKLDTLHAIYTEFDKVTKQSVDNF